MKRNPGLSDFHVTSCHITPLAVILFLFIILNNNDYANAALEGENLGNYYELGESGKGIIYGKYLYRINPYWGYDIIIYDIQKPDAPVKLSVTNSQLDILNDFAVVGNYAYMVGGIGDDGYKSIAMNIFDLSDPKTPVLVGSLKLVNLPDGVGEQIVTDGKTAYIATNTSSEGVVESSLIRVSVAAPQSPRLQSMTDTTDVFFDCLAMNSNWLYGIKSGKIEIYDISMNYTMTKEAEYSLPHAAKMKLHGDIAYVTCDSYDSPDAALKILDLSNPLHPALVSSYIFPKDWGRDFNISYYGGTVCISCYGSDDNSILRLLDVSDPHNLQILAELYWSGTGTAPTWYVDNSEGILYISGYTLQYIPQEMIKVSNLNRIGYRADYLRPRNLVYTDRSYEYTAPLPIQGFKEQTYIQTRHNDQYSTGTSFLRFTIDRPATVYVAYDERASAPPPWLAGWIKKGLRLASDDRLSPGRILYARDFPAGEVVLGGNRDAAVPAPADLEMYGVLIVPKRAGVEDWALYDQ